MSHPPAPDSVPADGTESVATGGLVLVAAGFWLLVAMTWGAQLHYAERLAGGASSLVGSLRYAGLLSAPWIPATILILLLGRWRPLLGGRWRRNLGIHLLAILLVALFTNTVHALTAPGAPQGVAAVLRDGASGAVRWIHVIAMVYLFLVLGLNAVDHRSALRSRELALARREAELARARLHAISAQLRPHFLFNVLHTIGQLWRAGRGEAAEAMLDGLGSLFRRMQRASEEQEVTLNEELALARAYLELERIRFSDRMSVEVEVEDGVGSYPVPSLILQPLVENAVRHGISTDSEAGCVTIRARRTDGGLVLEVEDDGPGPGAAATRAAGNESRGGGADGQGGPDGGGGTGLRIVRERLHRVYGSRQSFTLEAVPGGRGARARLELPAISTGRIEEEGG